MKATTRADPPGRRAPRTQPLAGPDRRRVRPKARSLPSPLAWPGASISPSPPGRARIWGLLNWDYTAKPAYVAFANLTCRLAGARYEGKVDLGPRLSGFLYQQPDGAQTLVFWSRSPAGRPGAGQRPRSRYQQPATSCPSPCPSPLQARRVRAGRHHGQGSRGDVQGRQAGAHSLPLSRCT